MIIATPMLRAAEDMAIAHRGSSRPPPAPRAAPEFGGGEVDVLGVGEGIALAGILPGEIGRAVGGRAPTGPAEPIFLDQIPIDRSWLRSLTRRLGPNVLPRSDDEA